MSAREDMPWSDEAKKLKLGQQPSRITNADVKKSSQNSNNALVSGSLPNGIDLTLLSRLLRFSSKYELSIQFWPEQTAVYIAKDGVDLQDYGGSFKFAVGRAIEYLERVAGGNDR